MEITESQKKVYLMTGGTFLPAFTGLIILGAIRKSMTFKAIDILAFAGLSLVGGFVTSKMLH